MHKQKERFRRCEKLAKKAKREAPLGGVIGCRKCPFYMPEFKYRKYRFILFRDGKRKRFDEDI